MFLTKRNCLMLSVEVELGQDPRQILEEDRYHQIEAPPGNYGHEHRIQTEVRTNNIRSAR